MGSTGEADRKRRNVEKAAVVVTKKQSFNLLSEDKKLDTAVLQFQNQKLAQKLEVQKLEISALEDKLSKQKDKQQSYDRILTTVNTCWEKLVDDMDTQSTNLKDLVNSGEALDHSENCSDAASCSSEDMFLQRLMETNPSENCLTNSSDQMIEEGDEACENSRNMVHNVLSSVDGMWCMKGGLHAAALLALPEGDCRLKTYDEWATEIKNLRSASSDRLLELRSLEVELEKHHDSDLKNKAELKHLQGELESTIQELEDCNQKLAALKAEKDATKGAFFPVLSKGNKNLGNDRATDKQKDLQEMESKLKELTTDSSSRLQELKRVHEERVEILKKLTSLQGTLKNMKCISSARAFKLVKEELEKSKADVIHCQALYEKLQVQKDKVLWKERDASVRFDLSDTFKRTLTTAGSSIDELGVNIQRLKDQMRRIRATMEEASREPGRKEIISNFREFVSSFPEDMNSMQRKLKKYKDTASDVHSLRAEVQSMSNLLVRKAKESAKLSSTSIDQDAEIRSLQAVVQDLKESEMDLKLFAEMYSQESVFPRNVSEARDKEYMAWARVHSLKLSLDEENMESRVKTAIQAEALSQQRLAAAEAEIADLRKKCESRERKKSKLMNDLKSKHDENEAYLAEIETIGQAYDDMRNQNQQLLKQITERDDYNIKLVLEGLRGKQTHDLLLMEKEVLQKKIQQANVSQGLFEVKMARIQDQVKSCIDLNQRHAEDRCHNRSVLENIQRKTVEARNASQQARKSLDEMQAKVNSYRVNLSELQIELEKERFEQRRLEEELEASKRKAEQLIAQKEGSVVGKLQLELQEYKEILKCGICHDNPKEVVITKCYHLSCNPCVQKVLKTRRRKCPVCAATFGPNDVKSVYI